MTGRAMLLFGTMVLVLVFFWPGADEAWAKPVRVSASQKSDHGQIVFNWGGPVPYTAEIRGNRLVIRFGERIEASYGRVVRTLRKYIRKATPGADGRSVTFTLTGSFELGDYDTGTSVVVSLYGTPAAQPAPKPKAQPKPKTQPESPATAEQATVPQDVGPVPSGDLPRLRVRMGEHRAYSRVVFDWPRKVDYGVAETAEGITIVFAQGARPDLRKLNADPPNFVRSAKAGMKGKRLAVAFRTVQGVGVKHFYSGTKVVLDILKPTPRTIAQAKQRAAGRAQVPKPADSATTPPATQPPAAKPPADQKTAALAPAQPPALPSQESSEAARPRSLAPPGEPPAPAPASGAVRPPPPPAPVEPVSQQPLQPAEVAAVSLRFDWDEPVAAAVFRRAGGLWVIFDKAVSIDPNILRRAAGNTVRKVIQVPSEEGTVFRMETVAGINPSLRRQGLAWILDLGKRDIGPVTEIEAKAQPNSPIGARIFLPVPEPGKAIAVRDPEVGDNLIIIPVIPLGHGIGQPFIYPQVQVLPTAQGIVIRPWVDNLRVRPLRQGVEVTSEGALQISAVSAQAAAGTKLTSLRPMTRLFDLEKWRRGSVRTFTKFRHNFQRAVALTRDPREREKRRLDLARFYFASGYAAEALGVLRVIEGARPEVAEEAEFRGLKGASNFLMNRFKEAQAELSHPSLEKNDEGKFWLAATEAVTGDLFGAARELKRTSPIIRPYPKPLKLPMGLLVVEAALETGDLKKAKQVLDVIKLENPTEQDKAQLDYVEGRVKELEGDFDGAVEFWEKVMKSSHRPTRAKAAVARGELLHKLERISGVELIEELEKLRFSWRGDEFEFALLRRLGGLYLDEGGFRDGLRTLKQAATHFRANPEAPKITQKMADTFAFLYLEDGADALPPVTAIALYDEFKELTPAGRKGDEMIRQLADRLVSVDLLDRAAMLLEAQVKFRLTGAEKSRVGARLALVYLLNQEPEKAMTALNASEHKNVAEELSDQRRHLKARVLAQLKQHEEALTLLKGDKSMEADLLRADVFWEMKDWPNSAQVIRRLTRAIEAEPGNALNEKQARYVLNLAIALTLGGNERGIDRLRRDFGSAMDQTRFREAFQLIARPQTKELIDYSSIASRVAEAENFQSFMTAYRERLKEGGLSAIN